MERAQVRIKPLTMVDYHFMACSMFNTKPVGKLARFVQPDSHFHSPTRIIKFVSNL